MALIAMNRLYQKYDHSRIIHFVPVIEEFQKDNIMFVTCTLELFDLKYSTG